MSKPALPANKDPVILLAAILVFAAVGVGYVGSLKGGRAEESAKQAEAYVREATLFAQSGMIGSAIKSLETAKRLDPKALRPRLMRAQFLAESTRIREAYDEMLEADRIAPNDHEVTMQLLRYTPPYLPPQETEKVASKAVKQAPADSEAWYRLGLSIAQGGRRERIPEALNALEESNRRAPMQPLTLLEMGKLRVKTGDSLRAVAELKAAWSLLERRMVPGQPPPPIFLEYRRTTAFWLIQAYNLARQTPEARAMTGVLAKLEAEHRRGEIAQARASARVGD